MNNVLEDSLFVSQNKKFDEIQSIVRQFLAEYVGNSIIKDNIFAVIQNYARKKEIALEMLRYPIHDDELWALTFLKQDTIFVCVNTALPLGFDGVFGRGVAAENLGIKSSAASNPPFFAVPLRSNGNR